MMENEKKRVLIISGGKLDIQWAAKWLSTQHFDYIIAADSGLEYADALHAEVDFLLGDYDSVDASLLEKYRMHTSMVTYPSEKDYTDTHLALIRAVEFGAGEIAVIGATGSRYDHAMTNIYNMLLALEHHVDCAIYDPNNKIYLADRSFTVEREKQYGKYVSFIPVTDTAVVTLSGVKYPLDKYALRQGLSICQSNEIIAEQAKIQIESGILVVFETRD